MKAPLLLLALICPVLVFAEVRERTAEEILKLKIMADTGHAPSQYTLGVVYFYGSGVPRDTAEAVKWFRKAATQHDPFAELLLGRLYSKGEGVERDQTQAVVWLDR